VQRLAERVYFEVCRGLGRALRSARYATIEVPPPARPPVRADPDGAKVLKARRFYAPLLVALGGPLMRALGTGVRVLPQRDWEARERHLYESLHGAAIETTPGGGLLLPRLPGRTLAELLEDPTLGDEARTRAVDLAVRALVDLHESGFTHGDAMAENVLVDLDHSAAHWFDFETVHDQGRPLTWRRADDLRALVATCWIRSDPERRAGTLGVVLDGYRDAEALDRAGSSRSSSVVRLVADFFDSPLSRALPFHLGQAPLTLEDFEEIGRLVTEWMRAAD
jgi:hypothetical protein